MFYSLVQTLVCVLLINGGLYALHLTGNNGNNGGGGSSVASITGSQSGIGIGSSNSGSGSSSSSSSSNNNPNGNLLSAALAATQQQQQQLFQHHQQQQQHHQPQLRMPLKNLDSAARLNEELADMAQLERERLMLLGLAKQTTSATGHHGRPIITGRIQMTPAEDEESDYAPLLSPQQQQLQQQQAAKNVMFGSVVKHPAAVVDDYDSMEDFDGGGMAAHRRRPVKYEYGRVVQPTDRQYEPPNFDLDAFMDLEGDGDMDDIIPDLDGYQYLDELLAEEQPAQAKGWEQHQQQQGGGLFGPYHGAGGGGAHNGHQFLHPYETLEELEANPPLALQELFEKEQRDEAKQHANKARSGYNIRLQQKWQRKRAQQQQQQHGQKQPQLQRNIFGGRQRQTQQHQLFLQQQQQKQQHYYNPLHTKLSFANSEATATSKHMMDKSTAPTNSNSNSNPAMQSSSAATGSNSNSNSNSQTHTQANTAQGNKDIDASADVAASTSGNSISSSSSSSSGSDGGGGGGGGVGSVSAATADNIKEQLLHPNHKRSGVGMQPPVTHSIASQLMLRTARGQRQYDVPQIECPTAMDGMERFACPTPDVQGRYRCIDDHVLCDGFIDCPEGEDEDRRSCMFYKTTKAHLDVLADALLRWARGR